MKRMYNIKWNNFGFVKIFCENIYQKKNKKIIIKLDIAE